MASQWGRENDKEQMIRNQNDQRPGSARVRSARLIVYEQFLILQPPFWQAKKDPCGLFEKAREA
jgi:hypothetical protein